jgi:FHS family L-fucose permease-like MFS transporter
MIGRWASAIHAFELKEKTKHILTIVVPLVAFGIVLGLTSLAGHDVSNLYAYIVCVVVQIIGFYLGKNKPARTLFIFSVLGLIATIIGFTTVGIVSVYALLSVGLFCSIMWPCIFSLSLGGLGKYQAQGSAFLIMMILGGAIIPPIQGKIADDMGIHISYFIPVLCFAYLAFFALRAKAILKSQGINVDEVKASAGH